MVDGMSGCRNVWWERASHFTVAASRFPKRPPLRAATTSALLRLDSRRLKPIAVEAKNTASAAVLPRAITDAEICELECTTEPVIDQMSVGFEGVGGGVVTHPALQAQWAGAFLDQQRGARVAQRVQPDSLQAGTLCCGLKDAISEVLRSERPSAAVEEHEVLVLRGGRS